MNSREKRRLDKNEREMAFMTANAGDYAAGSPGARIMPQFAADIAAVKNFAAGQAGGASGKARHIDRKREDLDDLREMMLMLDTAADALADEHPGIENLFGLPRNRSEQSILAAARAQYLEAEQYADSFVEYDVPATFRADMLGLINRIDAANNAADTSGASGAGATTALKAALERLNRNSKKLDSINRIKYRANPAKMGAWLVASHLEREARASEKLPTNSEQ